MFVYLAHLNSIHTWLHFQSYLCPLLPDYLSLTIRIPISSFKLPFTVYHLWKMTSCSSHTIAFSFPYYYLQLRTPGKSHFHCSLPKPYQKSSTLPSFKTPSHYPALCFPQYPPLIQTTSL